MELQHLAFQHLGRSNVDKRHPFRTCWLSTAGQYPDVRTVIKRRWYDEGRVLIFTDSRSQKVSQMTENPRAGLVFYHPRLKLQVRMRCLAELIREGHEEYPNFLQQVKQSQSVSDYTNLDIPGSMRKDKAVVHGKDLFFTAISLAVVEIDVVLLRREGHLRSKLEKENNKWVETPLIP